MEGGMLVEELDWGSWRGQREEEEYGDDDDPTLAELAKQDLADFRKYVLYAPKRRAVPEGTCPLELFHMLLFPKWRVDKSRWGLGQDATAPSVPGFWFYMQAGFHKIRKHQAAPLYWHRSAAAALHKSAKPGPLGKRAVHILPVFGKGYYAKRLHPAPTLADHGFVRGRRRENAVLIALNTSWRLRSVGRTHALCLKDMSNAFSSSTYEAMSDSVDLHVTEHDRALCRQRFEHSVVGLPSCDGEVTVKPFQGGTMGDPYIVSMFLATFSRPVTLWGWDLTRWDRCAGELRAAWGALRSDLSLLKYADDLNET
eukprot:4887729-Pyramimonas_sp.AAC.1